MLVRPKWRRDDKLRVNMSRRFPVAVVVAVVVAAVILMALVQECLDANVANKVACLRSRLVVMAAVAAAVVGKYECDEALIRSS